MNEPSQRWCVGLILLLAAVFSPLLAEAAEWFSPYSWDPDFQEWVNNKDMLFLEVPEYGQHGNDCDPTSAGMLLAWWDRQGDYGSLRPTGEWTGGLDRLLPDHTAEHTNWWWDLLFFWTIDTDADDIMDGISECISEQTAYSLENAITDYVGEHGLRVETESCSTFEDYQAEIRAGRPVIIVIKPTSGWQPHAMVGVGFDARDGKQTVLLHDTWGSGRNAMTWGGTYDHFEHDKVITVGFLLPELTVDGAQVTPQGYSFTFDNRLVGTGLSLSGLKEVLIENTGGMDLDAQITQNGRGDIVLLKTSPGPSIDWHLEPGTQLATSWVYTPFSRGPVTCEVTIQDMSPLGLDTALLVQGNGVAPQALFDFPTDVGPVRIGTTAVFNGKVANVGDGVLSGEPPDVSWLNGTVGAVSGKFVGAGGTVVLPDSSQWFPPSATSQRFSYRYTPTEHATDVAGIPYSFSNGKPDGTNMPFSGNISVGGIGVGPEYESSVAPGSMIDFGEANVGTPALLPLAIGNNSPDDCSVLSLTDLTLLDAVIDGPDAGLFSLLDFTPGMRLHQSDQASFLLEFAPTPSAGLKEATLTFITDQGAALGTPGESFVYTLVGIAVPEPSALILLTIGALALTLRWWRRRR